MLTVRLCSRRVRWWKWPEGQAVTILLLGPELRKIVFKLWVRGAVLLLLLLLEKDGSSAVETRSIFKSVFTCLEEGREEKQHDKQNDEIHTALLSESPVEINCELSCFVTDSIFTTATLQFIKGSLWFPLSASTFGHVRDVTVMKNGKCKELTSLIHHTCIFFYSIFIFIFFQQF